MRSKGRLSDASIANSGRTITVDIHTVTADGTSMKLLTLTISVVLENGGTMMPDIEKVIKGLEGVYLCISPVNHTCGDCPYQDNHVECVRRVLSDAIALLKEQEPVEPEVEVLNDVDRIYRCPKCHKCFFYEKQKFCDQCGQAVKWE